MKVISDINLARPLLNLLSITLLLLLLSANSIAQNPELVEAQQFLQEQGFEPGPADGLMGPQTRKAIEAFQLSSGLAGTGELDQATLAAIRAFSEHEEEVRFVQEAENRNEPGKDFEIRVVDDPNIGPGEQIDSDSAQRVGMSAQATSQPETTPSPTGSTANSGTQYLWNFLVLIAVSIVLIAGAMFLLRFRRRMPEQNGQERQIRIEPTLGATSSQFAADGASQEDLIREPPRLFRDPDEIKLEHNT